MLQIVAWSLIPMALNRALGQVLLASLREKITLRIVIVNSVLSLIIGILLIASSGIIGAAIATVAARLVNLGQQYVPVSQVVNSVAIGKSIWKATLASLGMGLYLAAFAEQLGLWLAIPTGALVYGALLGLIIIWSHGGLQGVRMRYAHLRSK
ncbi:MAG: hypothetical protein HC893_06525 [Chloroflexaceae bacterium]|nr:hypothetical protein [Chloroflexaceae bacterium]